MENFMSLDYSKIVPSLSGHATQASTGEFITYDPVTADWGELTLSNLYLPEINILKVEASVQQDLHLQRREYESNTVDTCIFLDGTVRTEFSGLDEPVTMRKGMHNFIYKPHAFDDHYIVEQQVLRLLHISVDRFYYAALLSEQEKWSAELKEKLVNKKLICGSLENMQMSVRMIQIVNDIQNCTLSGSLGSIIIEAKILEFIALQLNQLIKENPGNAAPKIKSADRDALYDLREFLDQTFTKDHSLRNLAMSFGLNEFKLKRGFKELFGTTVFDYLHHLKMEYAKQLLAADEVYINEVSGMVGYKNPNHFSTAFKRKYGVNPAQFRK